VTVTSPGNQASTAGTAIKVLQIQAGDTAGEPLTYAAPVLPDGLKINTATGQISGTQFWRCLVRRILGSCDRTARSARAGLLTRLPRLPGG
jgi:hypothetical protein